MQTNRENIQEVRSSGVTCCCRRPALWSRHRTDWCDLRESLIATEAGRAKSLVVPTDDNVAAVAHGGKSDRFAHKEIAEGIHGVRASWRWRIVTVNVNDNISGITSKDVNRAVGPSRDDSRITDNEP